MPSLTTKELAAIMEKNTPEQELERSFIRMLLLWLERSCIHLLFSYKKTSSGHWLQRCSYSNGHSQVNSGSYLTTLSKNIIPSPGWDLCSLLRRYICENIDALPLCVVSRVFDTHDILLQLVSFALQARPLSLAFTYTFIHVIANIHAGTSYRKPAMDSPHVSFEAVMLSVHVRSLTHESLWIFAEKMENGKNLSIR